MPIFRIYHGCVALPQALQADLAEQAQVLQQYLTAHGADGAGTPTDSPSAEALPALVRGRAGPAA